MNNPEILVIDDEAAIRKLLSITLHSNGYSLREAATAQEGLIAAANHPPDLILLDLGLPDLNGHEVLKQLREWYRKSILILSAQNGEDDIVRALDAGANDYITKPFRTGELLARIRSALRQTPEKDSIMVIDCEELQIDLSSRTVKVNNDIVKLTTTEYTLLALFAQHEGKVLTHQFLLKQVWGPAYLQESQYLRVYIAQLRKKIEPDPNRPIHLLTESGVGYRFIAKK